MFLSVNFSIAFQKMEQEWSRMDSLSLEDYNQGNFRSKRPKTTFTEIHRKVNLKFKRKIDFMSERFPSSFVELPSSNGETE